MSFLRNLSKAKRGNKKEIKWWEDKAFEEWILDLEHKSAKKRRKAACAIGKIGDAQALDAITKALKDKDKKVRSEAALALGAMGDKKAADSLFVALKDKNDQVRENAARALAEIKDTSAVAPLIEAIKDKSIKVQEQSLLALSSIAKKIESEDTQENLINKIAPSLIGENDHLSKAASFILYYLPASNKILDKAVDLLLKAIENESEKVQKNALRALSKIARKGLSKETQENIYYSILPAFHDVKTMKDALMVSMFLSEKATIRKSRRIRKREEEIALISSIKFLSENL